MKGSKPAINQILFDAIWQNPTQVEKSISFWQNLSGVVDFDFKKRAREAVIHVLVNNEIVGISTAMEMFYEPLSSFVYLYRCYIKEDARLPGLDPQLLVESFKILEKQNDNKAIGILVVSQADFVKNWNKAIWPGSEMMFIGNTPKGYPVRVRYFKGAKIQPLKQAQKES